MGRILIIDDERAIRRALREILEFEEFEVDEAENGKQGLDKAKSETYDIIFCDIKMPELDGMEVLEGLKNAKIDIPVIMISGHGNVETAVQAIKKGAFDFIEKPLDLNRILVTLRNANDKTVLIEEKKVLKKTVNRFKGSSIIGETEAILQIKEIVKKYKGAKNWHWVQEEPLNMGSWDYIHRSFTEKKLKVISRPASSSTAEGSAYKHQKAQSKIIAECFNP